MRKHLMAALALLVGGGLLAGCVVAPDRYAYAPGYGYRHHHYHDWRY